MQHRFSILLLSLLTALCLGFAACSDSGDDLNGGTAKDYEVNDYYTDLLQQAWKITEHEYADKSYYTKDFKTSWVINSPFHYDGKVYCPFNYKLSLQSEINYVEEVEVGTFPDGEDWIVDLGTGRRLFAIEDLHYGGNYFVMILRDTAGNRFRCHSIAEATILFVENTSDRTLQAQYLRTFKYTANGTSTVDELDYTIKSLPTNTIGAYAVLLDNTNYDVEIKFTASNGNSKLLTCSNLNRGWNRGEISGDFSSSEEPDEPETPEYDTEMEEALLGTWLSDNNSTNFFNYYNFGFACVFDYRIESYSRFISTFDATRIRVKNEADGSKWAVDESGKTRFFEIRNFKAQASMEIRLDGQSEWTLLYCYSDNARVFFIENGSSYEMLEVTYNSVTGGIAETIYPDCFYVAMQDYHYQGMLGINGWIFPETYTVNATVKAYKSSSSTTPDAEFEYTAEAIAGATFTRATITDDDIPYKPNSNDVARLESLLWQGDKAVAWRIPIKNSYGWLITESIGLRQGLHIGGDISGGSISSNYYLKIENDRLYLAPYESYWKNIEILTPVSQIIEKGYMDIRIESKNDVFRCFYCNKPLILYAERKSYDPEYNYSVIDYAIIGKDAYGNTLPERICYNFNSNVTDEYPISAWCLAADEIISPDNDSFTVKMEFKKYDKLGNGPVLINEYTNLRLGQTYSLNL